MDKRRFKRKIVNIKAEIIYGAVRCASIIENISPGGVYAVATPAGTALDFEPGSSVELKFAFPTGEKLHLHCRIKWSYKTPPHELTSSIGMEIMDAPPSFGEKLDSLE
jgi:hypothetical protein